MSFCCKLCCNNFVQKINLQRHLSEKRCKSVYVDNYIKINELIHEKEKIIDDQKVHIEELLKQLEEKNSIINAHDHAQINNKCNNVNNINMKVEIIVNSINKLDVNYIDYAKMKDMIEKYDQDRVNLEYFKDGSKEKFTGDKVNILLGDYIKDIICNSEHPENHAVKYIKKHPPTYNSVIESPDGSAITVIKGLKDTCELLSDPILNKLKKKMIEFCKKYYKDDLPEFDYMLYENAIKELKKELNKANVKKALNSVLKNDILNNIEMKLTKA